MGGHGLHAEEQTGSVLVISLVVLIVLGGASASVLSISVWRSRESSAYNDYLKTLYAAESGISLSLAEITAGLDYDGDGTGSVSGTIDGIVYNVVAASNGDRKWTLTSSASTGVFERDIEVTIQQLPTGVFRWLAFGSETVTVIGETVCDSYDSAKGTYESQESGGYSGDRGDIASDGIIRVTGTSDVYGNAVPGPGDYVEINGTACVHGSTVPAEKEVELPGYSYEPPIASEGGLSSNRTLAGGSYRFSFINLTNTEVLRLGVFAGDEVVVYVDGGIRVTGNAQIEVLDGAMAVIHHGGMWNTGVFIGGGGVVNGSGAPAGFIINSASTRSLVFAGSSDFYGAVFSPEATVKLAGNNEFYGALTANEVELNAAAAHFDEALAYPDTGGFTYYKSVSWRIVK